MDIDKCGDRATAASTGSWLMRAGSGGLHGEGVSLDIADVVRDELTILRKEIEEPHAVRAGRAVAGTRGITIQLGLSSIVELNQAQLNKTRAEARASGRSL